VLVKLKNGIDEAIQAEQINYDGKPQPEEKIFKFSINVNTAVI